MKQDVSVEEKKHLHVTILTVGSRGDVQPYCALGLGPWFTACRTLGKGCYSRQLRGIREKTGFGICFYRR